MDDNAVGYAHAVSISGSSSRGRVWSLPRRRPGSASAARDRGVVAHVGWALRAGSYLVTAVVFRVEPGPHETALFTRINDGPNWRWLRAPQQLGIPWVLPGIAVAFWARGHRRDAPETPRSPPAPPRSCRDGHRARSVGLCAVSLAPTYVRVHQGAHHPSDTLGGFFLGLAVTNALEAVIPRRADYPSTPVLSWG